MSKNKKQLRDILRCYYGKPRAPKMTATKSIVLAQQFDDGAPVILSYPVSAFSEPFHYTEDLSFYETESEDMPVRDYAADFSEDDDYVESFDVDVFEHNREKPCGCQDKTAEKRSALPAYHTPAETPSARPAQMQSLADDDLMADIHSILSGAKQYDEKSKQVVKTSSQPRQEEIKPLEQKSEHQIFDKLAQSMRYANAYDLGAISLQNRFEAFDKQADQPATVAADPYAVQYYGEEEPPAQKAYAPARPAAMTVPERAGVVDFVEDLDVIMRREERPADWAELEMAEDPQSADLSQPFTVPAVSLADIRKRLDNYLDKANAEYTLPNGTKVRALPQFKYGRTITQDKTGAVLEATRSALIKQLGRKFYTDNKTIIVNAMYGKPDKVQDLTKITQALIDSGGLANPGTASFKEVRALQRKFKIGIDCAAYVQQAFIYVFTGKDDNSETVRTNLGLKPKMADERLDELKDQPRHFQKVDLLDARTGDLIILKPHPNSTDGANHTVIVAEHTIDPHDSNVHKFTVDASWGTDAYGEEYGGVARRTLCYNTSTKEWWDISPVDGSVEYKNDIGPYDRHELQGVYRAKQKP